MFKGVKLSQVLSVTKSCFKCSIWILNVMHTASYNRKKASNFDVDAGLVSTARTQMFCFKWNELTLFQGDAQYKALEREHTPHLQI